MLGRSSALRPRETSCPRSLFRASKTVCLRHWDSSQAAKEVMLLAPTNPKCRLSRLPTPVTVQGSLEFGRVAYLTVPVGGLVFSRSLIVEAPVRAYTHV